MRADPGAMGGGQCHGLVDEVRVARMEAGGDIGRADVRDQQRILRIADPPATEGLSHIAVDVDDIFQTVFPPLSSDENVRDETGIEKFNFCAIVIDKIDTSAQIKGKSVLFISKELV